MPYNFVILTDTEDNWSKIVYMVVITLAHGSSSINSILYAVINQRFRKGYKHFLMTLWAFKTPKREAKEALRFQSSTTKRDTLKVPTV